MHYPPLLHLHFEYPAAPVVGVDVDQLPPHGMIGVQDAEIHPGSTVVGTSGEMIGTLAEIYLDNQSGRCRWAQVSISGHRCLVPLNEARVHGSSVRVPVTTEQVTSAPHLDPATASTVDDEQDLNLQYSIDPPRTAIPGEHRTAAL